MSKLGNLFVGLCGALGGLACILTWLGIKPQDLWGGHIAVPHWLWLLFGLVLFVVSIGLSAYTFFRPVPASARAQTLGRPKWQKLQWANAERERLQKENEELKAVLPAPSPKLKIHRATFGAGPDHRVDITDALNSMQREGLVLRVDQNIAPTDPATGVTKTLDIEYSYDGGAKVILSRPESPPGQLPPRLVLPEDSEIRRLQTARGRTEKAQ